MLYKPKFCANCGEKIDRTEWKLWTSRRFCELCEVEQKQHELLPRAILAVGIIGALFGVGSLLAGRASMNRAVHDQPARTLISRPAAPLDGVRKGPETNVGQDPQPAAPQPGTNISLERTKESIQRREAAASSEKPVYFCGAMTRKGTPCTRRVKIKGLRCWQHAGQPSIAEER
jgi:hypothetical protein